MNSTEININEKNDEQLEQKRKVRTFSIITGFCFFILIGWFMQFALLPKVLKLDRNHSNRTIILILVILGFFFLGWLFDFIVAVLVK